MKHKLPYLLIAAVCLAVGIYFYFHVDMTGAAYEEIEAYRVQYPHNTVSYTVTIDGDISPLEITSKQTVAHCTLSQVNSLIDHADYLQHLTD